LLAAAVFLAALVTLVGCGPGATPQPVEKVLPLAGVTLQVYCPDRGLADVLAPLARIWAARTGATVGVTTAPMAPGDAADVGVIAARELGEWADRGELVAVPAGLRQADHVQWLGVLPPYRERLAGWAGQVLGVPLAGDGYVVVYRADRLADKAAAAEFQKRFGRPLAAPATWEDFVEIAEMFVHLDGRPSVPPLPDDDRALADLFSRVAACFDRPALNEAAAAKLGAAGLSFHHDVESGKPRLASPGFVAAAGWLARLKGCRPAAGAPADPVAALAADRGAVLAVLTLEELARLPKEEGGAVPARFGLAQLPGSRAPADAGKPTQPGGVNYVPYFAGGRLGVVRRRCPHPDAAFDLLTELGGPARSLELVSAEGLGVGPFRTAHLDRERSFIWYGYKLDPKRSGQLQEAMRHYVGLSVGNPTYGLRGPDQAALTAALAGELRRVAGGEVSADEGMTRAAEAWSKTDAGVPPDKLLQWRRRSAGLN
jgi:ABC-type glycerol-3-phosphate transport system substrate-binding protein